MSPSLFCHSCGVLTDVNGENIESESDQIVCSSCGSDVVELVDTTRRGPVAVSSQNQSRNTGNRNRTMPDMFGPGRFFAAIFNGIDGWGEGLHDDWMDRLASQLMEEQTPSTKPTSKRAQDNLMEVLVRPQGSEGDPGFNESFTCAGEPCSVCHDEFCEGEKVAELPCCHVRPCPVVI